MSPIIPTLLPVMAERGVMRRGSGKCVQRGGRLSTSAQISTGACIGPHITFVPILKPTTWSGDSCRDMRDIAESFNAAESIGAACLGLTGSNAMKTELQRLFLEEVQKNFGFLQPKFKGPFVSEGYCSLKVVFLGDNLAIELVLDEREKDISCYIARVIEGNPAPHGFVDPVHGRIRGHFYSLLLEHGFRGKLFTLPPGLSIKDQIPLILSGYASALKKYGQRVLDDDPEFLNI